MSEIGRTTVANTATRLDAATDAECDGCEVTALATNTEPVFYGYDNTVTTSTGVPIYPGVCKQINRRADRLWFISASGSQAVAFENR
jgi:hypothetical protein